MNVLVVGSGAREHAIAWKVGQSTKLGELHAAPGNAGIAQFATCHEVDADDIDAIVALVEKASIDLVVVGSEGPLVGGLCNRLRRLGILCVGPSAAASRIEGSKVFAKELMDAARIPTARWEAFSDVQAALAAINRWRGPVVIKADGLTGGKGAFLCMSKVQAERALTLLLVESSFGVAGRRVIVEEYLQGSEASLTVLTDGEHVVPLPVVRTSKRLDPGDTGPNTCGMGSYAPCNDLLEQQVEEAIEAGIKPAIDELRERGLPFSGVLNANVMFTRRGPKILEFNCRFGDPDAQLLVSGLDVDLLDLFERVATSQLEGVTPPELSSATVALTLVAGSYPARDVDDTPVAIDGIEEAAQVDGVEIFVGSAQTSGSGKSVKVVAPGGRVLTVVASAESLARAREQALQAAGMISFDKMHHRADIAEHVVEAGALA